MNGLCVMFDHKFAVPEFECMFVRSTECLIVSVEVFCVVLVQWLLESNSVPNDLFIHAVLIFCMGLRYPFGTTLMLCCILLL